LTQPVAPYWVELADQLRMTSDVSNIRGTLSNNTLSLFLRDLLYRWLNKGCPTLEKLCQALRSDDAIIGGAQVATELEEEFKVNHN